jgi:hypothetical protein
VSRRHHRIARVEAGEGLLVIAGEPLAGRRGDLFGMTEQRDQVVDGILAVELRGVDQGHVEVADLGALLGLVEERRIAELDQSKVILPMSNFVRRSTIHGTRHEARRSKFTTVGDEAAKTCSSARSRRTPGSSFRRGCSTPRCAHA